MITKKFKELAEVERSDAVKIGTFYARSYLYFKTKNHHEPRQSLQARHMGNQSYILNGGGKKASFGIFQ